MSLAPPKRPDVADDGTLYEVVWYPHRDAQPLLERSAARSTLAGGIVLDPALNRSVWASLASDVPMSLDTDARMCGRCGHTALPADAWRGLRCRACLRLETRERRARRQAAA